MKPVLLVIDMQKAFYDEPSVKVSMDSAAEYINAALAWFREKAIPIYWIYHTDEEEGLCQGQEGFEFIDKLDRKEDEAKIIKRYENAFNKTSLWNDLKKQAVDTVFVAGFCAEYCVLSTYRGAQDLDLTPILIRGCTASGNPERIRFVEDMSEIISINLLKKYMENC